MGTTSTSYTLRDLPFPVKIVMTVFLISVGLGYLSALPIHELKIDKSFVSDLLSNTGHAAIVRSIADLGHNLGLRVVAEGVETVEVLEALREAGADVAQGYLFARPLPPAELQQWLLDGGVRRPRITSPAV